MEPNIEVLKTCLARAALEIKDDCKYMRMKTCLWDTYRKMLNRWKNRREYYVIPNDIATEIDAILRKTSDMLSGEIDDFNWEPQDGDDLADLQRIIRRRIYYNFNRNFLIRYNLYGWIDPEHGDL